MSTKLTNTTNATAVTPTREELLAQIALLDATTVEEPKQEEVTIDEDDTDVDSPDALGVIDPVKKLALEEKFHALLLNLRFWGNDNRITKLEAALVLPEFDDASMRMFYKSAKVELTEEEGERSSKDQRPFVTPTREQIIERAEFKYHEKYVAEPARKAEKEAKKAAKKK